MRRPLLGTMVVLCSLLLAACAFNADGGADEGNGQASTQEAWPTASLTMIVPFDPGGGTDTMARTIAPYLSEELGVPISVENRPPSLVGHTEFLNADPLRTVLLTPAIPYVINDILLQEADFGLGDFAFLNAQTTDFGVVLVPPGSDVDSLDALISRIEANPDEVSIAVSTGSSGHVILAAMLEELGIDQGSIRLVTYAGGDELRAAIVGGQVDATFTQAEAFMPLIKGGKVEPLAISREEPDPRIPSVPTMNEALSSRGVDVPDVRGSTRTLAMNQMFRAEHPSAWDTLIAAYRAVLEDPEYQADAEKTSITTTWIGPEATEALIVEQKKLLSQYTEVLAGSLD